MLYRILEILRGKIDFIVSQKEVPYLLRKWVLPRNKYFNIYLHQFLNDDDDRSLHDHPWYNMSIILTGGYIEYVPDNGDYQNPKPLYRRPGQIIFRKATDAHRIKLYRHKNEIIPAWTLFLTGPRIREWGFHCLDRWVHWEKFTKPENPGEIGKGCDAE